MNPSHPNSDLLHYKVDPFYYPNGTSKISIPIQLNRQLYSYFTGRAFYNQHRKVSGKRDLKYIAFSYIFSRTSLLITMFCRERCRFNATSLRCPRDVSSIHGLISTERNPFCCSNAASLVARLLYRSFTESISIERGSWTIAPRFTRLDISSLYGLGKSRKKNTKVLTTTRPISTKYCRLLVLILFYLWHRCRIFPKLIYKSRSQNQVGSAPILRSAPIPCL